MSDSDRQRVVLVLHSAHDEGGMERVFAELIRRAARDFDLEVISSELAPDLARLVDWRRVRVPLRPAPIRFLLFYVLAGLQLWRTRRTRDVVHACGAIVPNRTDLASVHFCHAGFRAVRAGREQEVGSLLRRMNTAIAAHLALAAERWSYRQGRTRLLGCVSQGVAAEVERAYPDACVVVTPNGVDPQRFRPDERVRAAVRSSAGVDDHALVALFVGGDWHRKGLGIALKALTRAADTRLWVIGKGDVGRFRDAAALLGVADRVNFLGSRKDTERYYQAADVLILPSRYEAFPLVSLEAAASGLPILATAVNGVVDVVGECEAGWILEPSGEAFGEALRVLSVDRERRMRMGRVARRRAQRFTWDASAADILDIYRDLARRSVAVEGIAA